VAEGRFRDDLFWRLHVVALELPPLRERPGDVPRLAQLFLERYRSEHRREIAGLTPEALALPCAAPWPGNVRQLENAIERAVLLARGPWIVPADLGPELQPAPPLGAAGDSLEGGPGSLRRALEEPERRIILRALEMAGGRRQEAAALLGVNRTTLFNKMRKYGLLERPKSAPAAPSAPGSKSRAGAGWPPDVREARVRAARGRRPPGQPRRDGARS